MLLELSITNFAIIDRLHLRLSEHLNVFTGETGAGKSILVDAVSALVGERTGTDVVRAGADRAVVEGIFDVAALLTSSDGAQGARNGHERGRERETSDREDAQLVGGETFADVLASLGIEAEEGTLILSREIARNGRSTARVNGRAVPVSALQQIAAGLIDIHGQSSHLMLLRPEQHIYYLDRFANCVGAREHVARLVSEWRTTRRALNDLQRDERELERRAELLRFHVDEIEAARLQPGEIETLERERRVLANAERLGELCRTVHGNLIGDETSEGPTALDLLAQVRHALDELLRLDSGLSDQSSALDEAVYRLEDVVAGVRTYQDEIAADPGRLMAVEERLDVIARLRRKYGATIEDIIAYGESAATELEGLSHREERAAQLQERETELREEIGRAAGDLSQVRARAAETLASAMERELDDLNMKRAGFKVEIRQTPDADGALVHAKASGHASRERDEEQRYAFGPTGIDRVEFLIAPNQGEPFKPLARIASGGETSRLMLALKTILSRADAVPVLIFDEIDAGISGRAGQVVGEKLWQLARYHQVICVTHLPQIAALGDHHYRVAKVVAADRTITRVDALDGDARIEEIGQMLGGSSTRASRDNAADLLKRGSTWKAGSLSAAQP